jgi:hypothetical protein
MSFFGRRDKPMTFTEELTVAVEWVTMRRFATLPEDEQHEGYRRLGECLEVHARKLREGRA